MSNQVKTANPAEAGDAKLKGPTRKCGGQPAAHSRQLVDTRPAAFLLEEGGEQRMAAKLPLLDLLAIQARCECVSDLKFIDGLRRLHLARELKALVASDMDLFDWNDALEYLTGCKAEYASAERAKSALIAALSEPKPRGGV